MTATRMIALIVRGGVAVRVFDTAKRLLSLPRPHRCYSSGPDFSSVRNDRWCLVGMNERTTIFAPGGWSRAVISPQASSFARCVADKKDTSYREQEVYTGRHCLIMRCRGGTARRYRTRSSKHRIHNSFSFSHTIMHTIRSLDPPFFVRSPSSSDPVRASFQHAEPCIPRFHVGRRSKCASSSCLAPDTTRSQRGSCCL